MFDLVPLSEYANLKGGYAFKSRDFIEDGDHPVIKIKNVRHGFINYKESSFIKQEVANQAKNFVTKNGDILISMTGSGPNAPLSVVGRVGRVGKDDPSAFINQRVGRIELQDQKKIDQDFIYYCLSSK